MRAAAVWALHLAWLGGSTEGTGDPAASAGYARNKDLKQIIRELEESDYGGYGSWGNFKLRREHRERKYGRDYSVVEADAQVNNQQLVRAGAGRGVGEVDYYRPQSAGELMEMLDQYNVVKSPRDKFSLRSIPSMGSFLRLAAIGAIVNVLAYISVAPHNVPLEEYNAAYKANLVRAAASFVWPAALLARLFRHRDADINTLISTFFSAFALYYPALCVLEKVCATAVRLLILRLFDPAAFALCPRVPVIHLPWNLRQHLYFPRRITLLLFLSANFCITAPLVEEAGKAALFRRVMRRCQHQQPDASGDGDSSQGHPPISVRTCVLYMLAVSLGIKAADNTRRILLYAAPAYHHKDFFAAARSLYPVQELCGALSALNYAKQLVHFNASGNATAPMRVSGRLPLRSMALHAMATMRGMKPLFVWDARRPWDEVQLQAWNAADARSALQLVSAGALNLAWFAALYKYAQVAAKKYFRLSGVYYRRRQEEAFSSMAAHRRAEARRMVFPDPGPPPPPPPLDGD